MVLYDHHHIKDILYFIKFIESINTERYLSPFKSHKELKLTPRTPGGECRKGRTRLSEVSKGRGLFLPQAERVS